MNRFFMWIAFLSCIAGCGLIYPAMWMAHFGTASQRAEPVTAWVAHLNWWEQVILFSTTPFASALLGGFLIGCIFFIFLATVWDATLGKLFK